MKFLRDIYNLWVPNITYVQYNACDIPGAHFPTMSCDPQRLCGMLPLSFSCESRSTKACILVVSTFLSKPTKSKYARKALLLHPPARSRVERSPPDKTRALAAPLRRECSPNSLARGTSRASRAIRNHCVASLLILAEKIHLPVLARRRSQGSKTWIGRKFDGTYNETSDPLTHVQDLDIKSPHR